MALEALPTGGVMGLTAGVAQTVPRVLASLFRLTPGGEVDSGFDAGLPNRIGAALLRRADGSILVAGDPASTPGAGSVARHLSGGTLDPFYTNAPAILPIRALLPASDGGVWVVSAGLPGPVRLRADDYVPPTPPVILALPEESRVAGAPDRRWSETERRRRFRWGPRDPSDSTGSSPGREEGVARSCW